VVLSFLFQASSPGNPLVGFLPILLIFAIFYFLLFLPVQRQKKRHQQMLAELKSGSVVETSGGIIGTIVSIDDETVVLRVKPSDTRLQFKRSAVSGVVTAGDTR
jgi:preprotein translocase subunit YajC